MAVVSLGGVKAKDTIDYNKKVRHYGYLNSHFTKSAPKVITEEYFMPRWEDDEKWKKAHKREGGRVVGKGVFSTYQEMRDACYELVNSDKEFDCSDTDSWCTSCSLGKNWDLSKI